MTIIRPSRIGQTALLVPAFNCGDGIHPSPLGYSEMGKSVDLNLFRRP